MIPLGKISSGLARRDALLVGVAQELLQRRAVLLDAVGKRIAVEQVAHLARIGRQPGQRIARDRGIEQALQAAALGLDEGVVEIS